MRAFAVVLAVASGGCIQAVQTEPVGASGVAHPITIALTRGDYASPPPEICVAVPELMTYGQVREERDGTSTVLAVNSAATTEHEENDTSDADWTCYTTSIASYADGEVARVLIDVTAQRSGSYLVRFATGLDAEVSTRIVFDALPDPAASMRVHLVPAASQDDGAAAVVHGGAGFASLDLKGGVRRSADGETWEPRTVVTDTADIKAIAYGAGAYVTVGEAGNIWTSSDALAWTQRDSGTSATLQAIVYGAGRFVAAGDSGAVTTSVDGVAWSAATVGSADLFSVAVTADLFAVQSSAGLHVSTDGAAWTPGTQAPTYLRTGAGSRLFAAGGGLTVYGSRDGVTWESIGVGPTAISFLEHRGRLYGLGELGLVVVGPEELVLGKPTSAPLVGMATDGQRLVLVGTGAAITIDFPSARFDGAALDARAETTARVVNDGAAPLYLTGATLSGDTRVRIASDDCANAKLEPGASCAIAIAIADTDDAMSAELSVMTSAADAPLTLPIHAARRGTPADNAPDDRAPGAQESASGCASVGDPSALLLGLFGLTWWRRRRATERIDLSTACYSRVADTKPWLAVKLRLQKSP